MNRFRTKKKAKEESTPRPSQESDSPTPFRLFGKGKKVQEEEPKKEIDIAAALPSNDDFRTSLLMTGLSARFSMLKEQDDPNTKIGKASDDSVLFSKRASRLDFGMGLGDIAENESIKAPPFARIDSFHSSEGSTSGSMMDRAKPTDGNNLFGGRQKIYKIPNSSTKAFEGGLGGKALYESDVSMSSFQRWRQAEKERQSLEEDQLENTPLSHETTRAESPSAGYDHKRGTNSTTSSTPSLGRNSTAATSVMSQLTNSAKDSQPTTSAHNGAPSVERSVTRTRRLYETGLMTDLQETQSSALSRMDTLARRNLGVRTPDLSNGPSPTGNHFPDRFGDRRVLAKASAPNLRSMNPALNGLSTAPMDLGIRTPSNPETKSHHALGGAPPLSPPISEAGEAQVSGFHPVDRNKSGAMSKSPQPFDEARFAQRQLQSHGDRETRMDRFRADSNASASGTARSRSRSSSSANRFPFERQDSSARTEPAISTVEEEPTAYSGTFLITDEETSASIEAPKSTQPGAVRPLDQDHPALRATTLSTPHSMSSRVSDGPSPVSEQTTLSVPASGLTSPIDSPTLGPASGLSGMVRQHMRSDSDASSVYGGADTSTYNNRPNTNYNGPSQNPSDFVVTANPWEVPGQTTPSSAGFVEAKNGRSIQNVSVSIEQQSSQADSTEPPSRASQVHDDENDDFARNLAEGARRVRERLTSYVESDSRSVSPNPTESREAPPSRPNPLNLLRSKSSRGSMVDRSRQPEPEPPLPKTNRLLGIGSSTMSSSPSPSKRSFDFERDQVPPTNEEPESRQTRASPPADPQRAASQDQGEKDEEKEEGVHAGLRAFRQARRDLQKLKETETQQRHMPPAEQRDAANIPDTNATPDRGRLQKERSPSYEHSSPPTYHQSRPPGEEPRRPMHSSRPPSRTDRDRSGSETSNGSRSRSRPARLRTMTGPHHDGLGPPMPSSGASPRRSPGHPMGEQWRSPVMGPQGQGIPAPPSGPPPGPPPGIPGGHFDRSPSGGLRLQVSQGRGHDLNQISPVSPLPPMPSPSMRSGLNSGASTPNLAPSPRRPSQPPIPSFDTNTTSRVDDSMRKSVRKKDISEPTFVSSTSRVPTVNLPENESRSRSGSRARSGSILNSAASTPNLHAQAAAYAPPLPPLNPKRRNMNSNRGGWQDEMTDHASHQPLAPPRGMPQNDGHSAFSFSDEEEGSRDRRRLRKAASEAHGINVRARQAQFGGAHAAPPVPMNTSRTPGGMI